MDMSYEEKQVYYIIMERTRQNPIKDKEISQLTKIDHREITDIIKRLVEVHKIPVGAAKEYPYGRFIIRTTQELNDYKSSLRSMQLSIMERIDCLNTAFVEYTLKNNDQLVLSV